MIYTPDCWVKVYCEMPTGESCYKILAGWVGGYLNGDSWQLNSGIESECVYDSHIDYFGHSGSVYRCYKNAYGMSGYLTGIYNNLHSKAKEAGGKFQMIFREEMRLD